MFERLEGSPGTALRALMKHGTVAMPGVYDGISARAAYKAGATALYVSGAGVTNSSLAVPDIALVGLTEMADQAARICRAAPLPAISDADTGFGDVFNVARTVQEMERAGLAGIHLEDQESPKRCGHLDGKAIVARADMARKIAAAHDSKRDPNFLLVARTDARGVEGLDSAIERAKLYVDHGADAVFPEGLESEEEFAAFRAAMKVPLIANMTEFGKTPIIPVARFADLGYEIVIFPMTGFRLMLRALTDGYAELLRTGTQAGLLDKMRTRKELYELIDYPDYDRRDREWSSQVE